MIRILLVILLAQSYFVSADQSKPRMRSEVIKAFTSDTISIQYGRSVKLLFPWPLDEYVKELKHVIDLADESVFTYDYQSGQNFIRVSYNNKGNFKGEVADLLINSHGYHFSFALKATKSSKNYHSLVEYKAGKKDKLEYLARERIKIRESINKEYEHKYEKLDELAEEKSLALLGKLALSEESTERVYEDSIIKNNLGDQVTLFVDELIRYDHIIVIPFEIKNDTNKAIYPKNIVFYQSTEDSNRSLHFASDLASKIDENSTGYGYVVTNDSMYDTSFNNNLEMSIGFGNLAVTW